MRYDSATVKAEGPYWHDGNPVVHLVREINPNFTMCHRWISVLVINDAQIMGYTNDTPNCLQCMVIER